MISLEIQLCGWENIGVMISWTFMDHLEVLWEIRKKEAEPSQNTHHFWLASLALVGNFMEFPICLGISLGQAETQFEAGVDDPNNKNPCWLVV